MALVPSITLLFGVVTGTLAVQSTVIFSSGDHRRPGGCRRPSVLESPEWKTLRCWVEERVERESEAGLNPLVDAELHGRDVTVLRDRRLGHPLERRQDVLQGDDVALSGRIEQEAVGRCSLAIGDVISIGRRQQDAGEHLQLVHRDRAVELAIRRVVEEIESALFGGRIVRVLVEDLLLMPGSTAL